MSFASGSVSPLTLNRLSVYLRCLRRLQSQGIERISSKDLAGEFRLSAAQFRKDLAQFGEFGIRGIGYDLNDLIERLERLLGLDIAHHMVVVGMGNLGRALVRYPGFNGSNFQIVAGLDVDPAIVGLEIGSLKVQPFEQLHQIVERAGARIGLLAVPAPVAQSAYENMVAAGIRAVLNFAPVRLHHHATVYTKNVDLKINLEELSFFLQSPDQSQPEAL